MVLFGYIKLNGRLLFTAVTLAYTNDTTKEVWRGRTHKNNL